MPAYPPFADDDDNTGGLVAKQAPGDNASAMSITEISQLLKRTVEDRFGFVRVRGELSGVKRAASGHLYLSLKDEGARLDGVMWKGNVARLGFLPEDGVEVIATGKLTTYPGRSNYQIVIERMEIAGEGALLALLAKTKARLEAEGLFDVRRKQALPFLPQVIGVVTSPTGAVIRDILHRLADRFPSHVVLWPVLVQGQGAAEQVAAAIRGFAELAPGGPVARPDVLIVGRGGGSIEDLWAFNEEVVVRAIADCPIPVISAVGHETDTTLADFAADMRAPTPTAAAEMAVPVRAELLAQIGELGVRQRRAAMRYISLGRERLEVRAQRLPAPQSLLDAPSQALDEAGENLRRGLAARAQVAGTQLQRVAGRLSLPLLAARLERARERLVAQRLSPAMLTSRLREDRRRLDSVSRIMASLNPDAVLARGYVRVTGADGRTLVGQAQAQAEARLTLHFRDGTVDVAPLEDGALPTPRAAPAPPPRKPTPPKGPVQDDLFS
ncbi:MAG: exodeoxyribonuclease VII large subunit [Sphingomonadales bacterium]|nr:exodeoxyribonuclease VII large subunit [Sphingomonadales bacterium]MDE2172183.1 exodeoxyribonuclease VII large subunit [Sphingomonadales bacterium]